MTISSRAGRSVRASLTLFCGGMLLAGCGLGLPGIGSGDPTPPVDPTTPTSPPSPADPSSSTPVEPPTVDSAVLPEGTREVDVEEGETVQISFGTASTSVGDIWGILDVDPEGVAESRFVYGDDVLGFEDWENTSTGGGDPIALEITGTTPGTTQVRVQYCFRSELAEDCDQGSNGLDPEDSIVTVTVR